ncbi:hypothetical protein Lalb_Chr04g0249511 [Lupinus albus]|uniref:Uncharacterized protein n=1 Tax=Lupinus albus TaxID=3870 RepID=A0A6A4QPM9_LUPAL|nr:hypothetical protein Lalb_Chr04g0249511 [Lupinus albus]
MTRSKVCGFTFPLGSATLLLLSLYLATLVPYSFIFVVSFHTLSGMNKNMSS